MTKRRKKQPKKTETVEDKNRGKAVERFREKEENVLVVPKEYGWIRCELQPWDEDGDVVDHD